MGKLQDGMETFTGPNGTLCEADRMPARVVIPEDVQYFVMPGKVNDTAMAACCHPQPLHLVDDCYVWCELPVQLYANRSDKPRESTLGTAFTDCLVSNGDPRPDVYRLLLKSSAPSATPAAPAAGPRTALWVLMIFSLLYC